MSSSESQGMARYDSVRDVEKPKEKGKQPERPTLNVTEMQAQQAAAKRHHEQLSPSSASSEKPAEKRSRLPFDPVQHALDPNRKATSSSQDASTTRTQAPEPSSSSRATHRDTRETQASSAASQGYTVFEVKSPGGTTTDLALQGDGYLAPLKLKRGEAEDFVQSDRNMYPGGDSSQSERPRNEQLKQHNITDLKRRSAASAKGGWTGRLK